MSGGGHGAQSFQLPHQKSPSNCNFPIGSAVEVEFHEEGCNGVYFSGTVMKSSNKRTKKVCVEFRNLLAKEGSSEHLREYVHASSVRPEPPVLEIAKGFEVGDVVDAFYQDGWWIGVVSRAVDGGNLAVTFPHPHEELEFGLADLRPHLDLVNGNWVRPQKKEPSNPTTTIDKEGGGAVKNKRKACLSRKLSKPLKKPKEENLVTPKKKDGPDGLEKEVAYGLDSESLANIKKYSPRFNYQEGVSEKIKSGIPTKTLFEGLVPGLMIFTADGDNQRDDVLEASQTEPNANCTIGVVLDQGTQNLDKAATEPHEALATAVVDKSQPQNSVVDNVLNENWPENALDKAAMLPSEKEAQNSVVKVVDVVLDQGNEKQPETGVAPPSETSEPKNLPFVKKSIFWKAIESTEVFQRMPQAPHFQPLENSSESSREGLAIGCMVTFSNVVEKTSELRITDPISIMNDLKASLADLEKHGFDVGSLTKTIKELLVLKEREEKLLGDVGSLDNELREQGRERSRIEKERDEIMDHIVRLQTRLSLTDSAKVKNDEEIASLQVRMTEFNESISNLRSTFEGLVSKVM